MCVCVFYGTFKTGGQSTIKYVIRIHALFHSPAGSQGCSLVVCCGSTSWTLGQPACLRHRTLGPVSVWGRYRHYWPSCLQASLLLWRSCWQNWQQAGGRDRPSRETSGEVGSGSSCAQNTCSSGYKDAGEWISIRLFLVWSLNILHTESQAQKSFISFRVAPLHEVCDSPDQEAHYYFHFRPSTWLISG